MATLFIILVIIGIIHFVFEGILIPSARLNSRFKLFVLRDRLRNLKYLHKDQFDNETFFCLQDSINGALKYLSILNISVLINLSRTIKSDVRLRTIIEERIVLLDRCPIKEVQEIREEYSKIIKDVLFANIAGLFIYIILFIIPLILMFTFLKKIIQSIKNLVFLPEEEMERFVSPESLGLT